MADKDPFPEVPEIPKDDPQAEVKKLLYQAQLDRVAADHAAAIERAKTETGWAHETVKTRDAQDFERIKATEAHDDALDLALYQAYIDVAKAQIERAAARAQFVQTAATTIGSTYTAILAFSFTLASTSPERLQAPLPARGIVTTLFAGLAIVLSTAYVAFFTRPTTLTAGPTQGGFVGKQRAARNLFMDWMRETSGLRRRRLLQVAVMCLGASIIFLPAAFLKVSDVVVWWGALGAVVLIGLAWAILERVDPTR